MILTRRFGALRARPVFPAVTERDEQLDYYGDVQPWTREPHLTETVSDGSAA